MGKAILPDFIQDAALHKEAAASVIPKVFFKLKLFVIIIFVS